LINNDVNNKHFKILQEFSAKNIILAWVWILLKEM